MPAHNGGCGWGSHPAGTGPGVAFDQTPWRLNLARAFAERFKARHGSILCRELLGCAIDTPEGLQDAHDKGLFKELCPRLVQDSAEIVAELLEKG